MGAVKLVVFISSPGDVGQERLLTTRVLERLQGEFGNRLELWPVLWEHEPLRATEHFQEQVILPSQTDIVICILWSRLGTRLPEGFQRPDGSGYLSGTEWEFEDAIRAFQSKGSPHLLVYRRLGDPLVALNDEQSLLDRLQQKKALETFIDRWFGNAKEGFKAAFHTFQAPDEFESLLEVHLRRLLTRGCPVSPAAMASRTQSRPGPTIRPSAAWRPSSMNMRPSSLVAPRPSAASKTCWCGRPPAAAASFLFWE